MSETCLAMTASRRLPESGRYQDQEEEAERFWWIGEVDNGNIVHLLVVPGNSVAYREHVVEDGGMVGKETPVQTEGDAVVRHEHDVPIFDPDVHIALESGRSGGIRVG